jgi:ribosomal protein S15P/S13E
MMNIISQRKRMLQYLRNEDVTRYRNTISALGLRK